MRLLISLFILSGCAHSFMRGTVAMKIDAETAHVCLGNNDVAVGDKVNFLKNECTKEVVFGDANVSGGGRTGDRQGESSSNNRVETQCELKKVGEGTVTRLLNNHYSEVKTDSKFRFTETTVVQKQKI